MGQIFESVQFVDEVMNHIYLFIIKYFKETMSESSHAQNKWLTQLADAIAVLPNYVDELSCCIYALQMTEDEMICRHASNLLHFVWMTAMDIAEQNMQFRNRKMVIKNKKTKSKISLTGFECKCKFIDLNVQIGKMFGLVSMEHVNAYIEKDEKYKKQKDKQKKKKGKKKKCKQKKKIKKKDDSLSASSNKEPESTNPTDTSVQSGGGVGYVSAYSNSDRKESSESVVDID